MGINIKEKATTLREDLRLYWKKPPMGRYMSFKEIVSLAVGGLGIQFVVFCAQNMIISIGNTLISNTIGIAPKPLYIIYILSVILSFPLTALRGKIIDSSRSKKGRYRPFILSMGLPTALLAIGFVFMPYERMSMLAKCITVLLYNIGLQFFYMFYYDVDQSIINVLSPNTFERSDVTSIKSVINSLAPTLGNIILPLVARAITGENTLVDIRIYRAFYPPMIIFGFFLGLLVYFNTEEKIVQAKTHTVKIKFTDAFRAVVRNKYFWIISLAGWIGFLENAVQNIMDWLYSYQDACSPAEYSLIVTIRGNASLWPMLFIPFLIRVLGKRKILVVSNVVNVIFIILMLPIIRLGDPSRIIWPLMFCFFFNYMAAYAVTLLTPGVNGDIRDYQQYITGERIDGMFVAVGAIGSIVTLITNAALPELYDRSGLNEEVAKSLGFDGSNVYEVLSDPWYFKNICSVLIIAATVGATLNVIPYFFYDLTEIKQKAMVTVLKIRALFEDYGNGVLSDAALVEAIDIIKEAKIYHDKNIVKPTKDEIKKAKKAKDKSAVKAAKQSYKNQKEENEKIEIAQYVIKEINKFETEAIKAQLEEAKKIYDAGLEGLYDLEVPSMKAARATRKCGNEKFVFLENSYYSNLGIPYSCPRPILSGRTDNNVIFSPHAYDFMVDTPSYKYASNDRVGSIFAEHRRSQQRLGVPVIVGEWGGFTEGDEWFPHIEFLLDLFDSYKWSNTYWCYFGGFTDTEVYKKVLTRPHPVAVTGEIESYGYDRENKEFHLSFVQLEETKAKTEIFVPSVPKYAELDGEEIAIKRKGIFRISTAPGEHKIKIIFK